MEDKWELSVCPGSGYGGANWLMCLAFPAYDVWPKRWITLRAFRTEEEARSEAAKMVIDLLHSAQTQ